MIDRSSLLDPIHLVGIGDDFLVYARNQGCPSAAISVPQTRFMIESSLTRSEPACAQGGVLPSPPESVQVLRTLGEGRAARAQLVDAHFRDGRVVRCVEKVFAPGLLTRLIYRLSFQSPFGYQTNADAIATCFFRRRVAAAALAASDTDASIASPTYVRYDQEHSAWVLAAEWIDGRGIQPAPVNASRLRSQFRPTAKSPQESTPEIDQLVTLMSKLETTLSDCGLVGSGWQVAPRAMVSTANLLRTGDRYTVIDLESGIPAVLVPKYLLSGFVRGVLPPFDDLDAAQLRRWYTENKKLLTFRIGPEQTQQLGADLESLIDHSANWKGSEWALFRKPWRHFTRSGRERYKTELIRRWQQAGVVDDETASNLKDRPLLMRAIWWAGLLPWVLGRWSSRLIGNRNARVSARRLLTDRNARRERIRKWKEKQHLRLVDEGRLPEDANLSEMKAAMHRLLRYVLPRSVHRFAADRRYRQDVSTDAFLLCLSPRYQAWFGGQRVTAAIDSWEQQQRLSQEHAETLRSELCGKQVLTYTRGFGMHLALKTLAPVILPAKVGGIAAFIASGNVWFLLPMVFTPALRTLVTLWSLWSSRGHHVPHREALVTGLLPMVGSLAFPMQMFSCRADLSMFLIRDAAAKLGRRLPIYGGGDSRTELACIRACDYLIEIMQIVSHVLHNATRRQKNTEASAETRTVAAVRIPRTQLGRWMDRLATARIAEKELAANRPSNDTLPSQETFAA